MLKFTTDSLIEFFSRKLDETEEFDPIEDEDAIHEWWSNTKRCVNFMGEDYAKIIRGVTFNPSIYFLDERDEQAEVNARTKGLSKAKEDIRKIIDDLNTFGYRGRNFTNEENDMNININNSNNSNQGVDISLHLSDFDGETQKDILVLREELSKRRKNKEAIKKILSKLGETGLDALEKIFLHAIIAN